MTRQFDVVANPSELTSGRAPYLVVLQSHFLAPLATRLVAPLIRSEMMEADEAIALRVRFNDEPFTLAVALLANIEARRLGKVVGDLRSHDFEIRRALDRLFTGF